MEEDDEFPQTICDRCVERLQNSYSFILRCVEVHEQLQTLLSLPKRLSLSPKPSETELQEKLSQSLPDLIVDNADDRLDMSLNEEEVIKLERYMCLIANQLEIWCAFSENLVQ